MSKKTLKPPSKELRSEIEKAIWYEKPDVLRELLAQGIDPNHRPGRDGRSLLDKAATRGSSVCLPVLLEAGVDVNALDDHRRSALFHALTQDQEPPSETRIALFDGLVAAGIDLRIVDKHGQTALHWVAGSSNLRLLNLLLEGGLDANACDDDDRTPLFDAVRSNYPGNVRLLLDAGAHVEVKDWQRDRPLHIAAHVGAAECIPLLLSAGADPNAPGKMGESPIYRAAMNGRVRAIELLLAAGADVNAKTKGGLTAMDVALENGHEDAGLLLLASGRIDQAALDAALVPALRKGMARMVTVLAEAGADMAQRVNGKPLSSVARTDEVRRALRSLRTARAVESAMGGDGSPAASLSSDPAAL